MRLIPAILISLGLISQVAPPSKDKCVAQNPKLNNCVLAYVLTEVQIDPVNPAMKVIPVAGVKIKYRITSQLKPESKQLHINYTGTLTTNDKGFILFDARKDSLILFEVSAPSSYKSQLGFTLQTHSDGNARSITMLEKK